MANSLPLYLILWVISYVLSALWWFAVVVNAADCEGFICVGSDTWVWAWIRISTFSFPCMIYCASCAIRIFFIVLTFLSSCFPFPALLQQCLNSLPQLSLNNSLFLLFLLQHSFISAGPLSASLFSLLSFDSYAFNPFLSPISLLTFRLQLIMWLTFLTTLSFFLPCHLFLTLPPALPLSLALCLSSTMFTSSFNPSRNTLLFVM